MVSAVHAEDSSSASANLPAIRRIEWASAGILKVYPADGPFFCVRDAYLSAECKAYLDDAGAGGDSPLSPDVAEDLLHAARALLAERTAMGYLARSEYCRRQLDERLARKGFSPAERDVALSFLASAHRLDDYRYATAWLRSRLIHQSEGRRKLLAGLFSRGISSEDAERALNEFFQDTDERVLCERATEKMVRLGKNGEKLYAALLRKGFSGKIIAETVKKLANDQNNC